MTAAAEQGPFSFPARIWDQEQTRQMLRDRDIRNLLRLAHQNGVSQQHVSSATGIAQGHISDIIGRQAAGHLPAILRKDRRRIRHA